MSLRKMLGIISVVIIVMFSLMLTTSYAWYTFENASTTFSSVTNNDDITISYQHGEYISTSIAVPISKADVDKYSEKNIFNIAVKDNVEDNEIAVTVSLVEINIDEALQDVNFKVDLYYQGSIVSTVAGNDMMLNGETTKSLGTVILNNDLNNNFELRVYILDDGTDQSMMMDKMFQAKIQVNAVSRLKSNFSDYDKSDIYISAIMIDGEVSNSLPTSGYYSMTSSCVKGSKLTWDSLTKTITYESGSYINDSCSLTFVKSEEYPLLSEMPVGSYVKYVGNNGCDGKLCEGQNANYVSDINMGYCDSSNSKFFVNGWRIAYIADDSAYLVSAGATDCMCTDTDGVSSSGDCSNDIEDIKVHIANMNEIALKYCNVNYAKGGVCDSSTAWAMNAMDFEKITGSILDFDSCYANYSDRSCGLTNDLIDNGGNYWFSSSYNLVNAFKWSPVGRIVNDSGSAGFNGVRPVLNLESSVVVIGGSGTYEDPYIISNS